MAKKSGGKKPSKKKDVVKRAAKQARANAAQGNLPNVATDKDRVHHLQNIRHFAKLNSEAGKALTKAKKLAKEAGLSPEEITRALGMAKWDVLKLQMRLNEQAFYMAQLGLPLQIVVHNTKYDSPAAEAKVKGYADGVEGRSASYPEAHPEHESYMAAWMEGQEDLVHKRDKRKPGDPPDRGDGDEFEKEDEAAE